MMKLDTFLGGLLNSKRFWVSLIGLLVYVLGLQVPAVAAHADQLGQLVAAIVLALVSGYSLEQTATAWKAKPTTPESELTDLLAEVIKAVQPPVPPDPPAQG
jgi:hypothetical protein